mmetsp:Transcript_26129/g.78427  ORF Transcript_26129/g.78427 Transcript_26129/m.78427 type:complete len:364 (-) Transcript_26129:99-1190(-)
MSALFRPSGPSHEAAREPVAPRGNPFGAFRRFDGSRRSVPPLPLLRPEARRPAPLVPSPAACGEAGARLRAAAATETETAPASDYIERIQVDGMTTSWRSKITSWFGELGAAFAMDAATIAVATNYLDRYLSRRSCDSLDLQLAATASVFLASKVEEQRHFRTGDLVQLSAGLFRSSDLRLMELEITMVLGWRLNPATAVHQVADLVAVLGGVEGGAAADLARVEAAALAYAEAARVDYRFLRYPATLVAVAAVLCALRRSAAQAAVAARFVEAVDALDFPYSRSPDAAHELHACGRLLLDALARPQTPCGAELSAAAERAALSQFSDDDAPMDDAGREPSPTDVTMTGALDRPMIKRRSRTF